MSKVDQEKKILKRARELLQGGMSGSSIVQKSGHVGLPIPIYGPDHGLHSWFVPVTIDDLLAGFFQFQPNLTLLRYSSFQRHESSLEGCPKATLWVDSKAIRGRIDKEVCRDENVRELFLTYDKTPSHLVWMAVLETPDGTTRILYIAGNMIWEDMEPDAGENSFKG